MLHLDSLDHIKKESSASVLPIVPWQSDLQLNLETWKQLAKDGDRNAMIVSSKPLKFNLEYLQDFVEKAKTFLKKRSQQDLLLNRPPSS